MPTRARVFAEWLPAGDPTIGQGVVVTQTGPVRTSFATGQIPDNAVVRIRETEPPENQTTDGVFWLNPVAAELRVHLGGDWLQVSLPPAAAEDQLLLTGVAPDHEWLADDDLDGGVY